MMRFRVMMSVAIDAASDRHGHEQALKLLELLKSPMVRMAVQSEGIQLTDGHGHPVVHQPQREYA
jgi:hypothetical protein